MNNNKNNIEDTNKRKIEFPAFTIILMLILGIIGFIAFYSANETVKSCTSEVTGTVEREGHGRLKLDKNSEAGKYLSTGKYRRNWIEIYVKTDGKFRIEKIYAGVSYGREGDRLTIHYNPNNPDEYYIGEAKKLNGFGTAVVLFVLAGIMFILSVILMFYLNAPEDSEEVKKNKQEAKKKRLAEKKRLSEARLEQSAKRFLKNYTNPFICKTIKAKVSEAKTTLWILIFGISLCLSGVIRTFTDQNTDNLNPFDRHPLSLVFGIIIIIIGLAFSDSLIHMYRNIKPCCSGRKYQPKEIDMLANDKDTIWLESIEVLVTSEAFIGLHFGLTVVDYSDIYGIKLSAEKHRTDYRKWKTYRIIIETKNHKNISISENEREKDYRLLLKYLDKKNVEYKFQDYQN